MPCGTGQGFVGTVWQAVSVRTAYRCRAYPDAAQQAMLNRTFGCVRVVWNTILAARQQRYATQRQGTSYGQAPPTCFFADIQSFQRKSEVV